MLYVCVRVGSDKAGGTPLGREQHRMDKLRVGGIRGPRKTPPHTAETVEDTARGQCTLRVRAIGLEARRAA
eukprot:gene10228-biopygen5116